MSDEILQYISNETAVKAAVQRMLRMSAYAATKIVLKNWKQKLGVAGSGRVRGRKSGPIERSKPGEAPRKQTGELRASAASEVNGATGRVGTNLNKGLYLELGTSKIKPRPSLMPAFEESKPAIQKVYADNLGGL